MLTASSTFNFFMLFVGLALNKANDFVIMFASGNGMYAPGLVVITNFFWWRTVNEKG